MKYWWEKRSFFRVGWNTNIRNQKSNKNTKKRISPLPEPAKWKWARCQGPESRNWPAPEATGRWPGPRWTRRRSSGVTPGRSSRFHSNNRLLSRSPCLGFLSGPGKWVSTKIQRFRPDNTRRWTDNMDLNNSITYNNNLAASTALLVFLQNFQKFK